MQSQTSSNETATVKSGIHSSTLPHFVGATVGEVRENLASDWSMDTNAQGKRGISNVDDDYVIQGGDTITFVKRQGDKG